MASQANLKTVISADMSGFSATMRRAGSVANETGRKISRSMSPAIADVGRLAKGAALAGTALAGVALFKGIQGAAQIEQLGISFEVMTGSAEKGRKILDEIRQYGTETPYEFPALAKGAETLLQFGISAEQVLPTMRMIGDVAAGDEQKMASLALVFGQVSSNGKLMGGDLLQLINAGFNPLSEISKRTGESMVSLRKRMEQGALSADEVRESFKAATSAGGLFFQMTDKQGKTFNGRMSSLKDSINNALSEFSKPINIALLPHIEALSAKITEMTPQFIAIGEDIGRRMPEILTGIGEFANGAYKVWQIFQRVGEAIGTIFGTVFSPEYWAGVSDLISGAMMRPIEKMKAAWDAVWSGASLADAISEGMNAGTPMSDALINSALSQLKPFQDAMADLLRPIGDISDILPKVAGSQVAAAGKAAQDAQSDIYDKELEEQRKRVAADSAKMGSSIKWGGTGQSSGNRVDMGGSAGYVAQFDSLQKGLDRYASIGKDNAFARDRSRLGLASGLQTGGLGAVRAVGRGRDAEKKQETLAEKQLTATQEVAKNIRQALTVS